MPLQGKACEGKESPDAPVREKRAKAKSHLTPLRGKACEGEESPDAPVFAGLLRQLFTPLQSGVQLGCIA